MGPSPSRTGAHRHCLRPVEHRDRLEVVRVRNMSSALRSPARSRHAEAGSQVPGQGRRVAGHQNDALLLPERRRLRPRGRLPCRGGSRTTTPRSPVKEPASSRTERGLTRPAARRQRGGRAGTARASRTACFVTSPGTGPGRRHPPGRQQGGTGRVSRVDSDAATRCAVEILPQGGAHDALDQDPGAST